MIARLVVIFALVFAPAMAVVSDLRACAPTPTAADTCGDSCPCCTGSACHCGEVAPAREPSPVDPAAPAASIRTMLDAISHIVQVGSLAMPIPPVAALAMTIQPIERAAAHPSVRVQALLCVWRT